jgi:hypothetical protein
LKGCSCTLIVNRMYRHMEGYAGDGDATKIFLCLSNTAGE